MVLGALWKPHKIEATCYVQNLSAQPGSLLVHMLIGFLAINQHIFIMIWQCSNSKFGDFPRCCALYLIRKLATGYGQDCRISKAAALLEVVLELSGFIFHCEIEKV